MNYSKQLNFTRIASLYLPFQSPQLVDIGNLCWSSVLWLSFFTWYGCRAQPMKNTGRSVLPISVALQPKLITWIFNNWWKQAYLDCMTNKCCGNAKACLLGWLRCREGFSEKEGRMILITYRFLDGKYTNSMNRITCNFILCFLYILSKEHNFSFKSN